MDNEKMQGNPPIGWIAWVWVAIILGTAGDVGYQLMAEGRWFGALLGAVIYPLGALVQWRVLRNASPSAARAMDISLSTIWGGQAIFAMATVWG